MSILFMKRSCILLLLLSVPIVSGAQVTQNRQDSFAVGADILVRDVILQESILAGEITNTGKRIVKGVELTAYFLNEQGDPVYEKAFYPLKSDQPLTSQGPVTENEVTLKPGYAKSFIVDISDVPREWKGNINIVMTEITYTFEQQQ